MNIREVCKVLGVSPARVIDLVAAGDIPAYRVAGTCAEEVAVTYDTQGLRFKPSDLRRYLTSVIVQQSS